MVVFTRAGAHKGSFMHIQQFARFSLLVTLLAAVAAPALAQDKGDKGGKEERIATVNGVAVPKSSLELIMKERKAQGQPDNEEVRAAVRDQLIMTQILSQEAAKKGLAKRPDVVRQLDIDRQQVLARAYVTDFAQSHKPSDAEIKAEYESIKSQLGDREYKARHILLANLADAQDALAKLKKGEKFEDVARAMSKDPGSKEKGGELDWASPSGYVKPFSDAMVKLEKGKYTTEPVQTQFGFHIILLEDTRELKVPGMDEVKGNLVQRIQQKMLEQEFKSLRAKAKVE
jgi:peptidyl-prolyl cis-trans isomerase C